MLTLPVSRGLRVAYALGGLELLPTDALRAFTANACPTGDPASKEIGNGWPWRESTGACTVSRAAIAEIA